MKFVGDIGFWIDDVEVEPSVFRPAIVEKPYVGELIKDTRRWSNQNSKVDSDFVLNNKIRILADMYMNHNWQSIKFVRMNGTPFTVTSVDLDYPGITITIGGRYDGEESPRTGC